MKNKKLDLLRRIKNGESFEFKKVNHERHKNHEKGLRKMKLKMMTKDLKKLFK